MKWVKTKFLGQGSYATVSLAKPLLDTSVSNRSPILAVKSAFLDDSSSLVEEGKILHALDGCPEVLRCFGEDVSIEDGDEVYNLLLEYAPEGTLFDLIDFLGGTLIELEISKYAYMVLMGLSKIHEKGFVHCDLKPKNILVFPSTKGGMLVNRLKIADFGSAKRVGCPGSVIKHYRKFYKLRGTPNYSSPESILVGDYEPPMDVWAFGCIMFEIITGKSAYSEDLSTHELLKMIAYEEHLPRMPSNISKKGRDFLKKCFIRDPKERWSAKMLLNHPFIVDNYMELYTEEKSQMNWEGEAISRTPWRTRQSSFSTCSGPKPVPIHPDYQIFN